MKEQDNWVFYLQLKSKLSKDFLVLDRELKDYGKGLVPVSIENLLGYIKKKEGIDLLVVVKSKAEANYYNKRIKKVLRYLILSKKIRLTLVSSYQDINDLTLAKKGHYFFHQLPMSVSSVVFEMISTIHDRQDNKNKWPGASRPKMMFSRYNES